MLGTDESTFVTLFFEPKKDNHLGNHSVVDFFGAGSCEGAGEGEGKGGIFCVEFAGLASSCLKGFAGSASCCAICCLRASASSLVTFRVRSDNAVLA